MAIFVASLFLPYTANFEANVVEGEEDKDDGEDGTDNNTEDEFPIPETKSRHALSRSLGSLPTVPSLLSDTSAMRPPRTASSTNLEELAASGLTARRPALLRLPTAPRLATLTRVDTHSPGWGQRSADQRLAQPSSRAKSPPPASILRQNGSDDFVEDDMSFPTINRPAKKYDIFNDKDFTIEPSNMGNGGLVTAIDTACDNKIWVGTLGMPTNALSDKTKTAIKERLEIDFESVSIWVDDDDMNGLYEQYCKTILWPYLHYQIPDHPKSKAYQDHSWGYYVKVNEAFADVITKRWKKGDTIWIHDYHLMLVPGMIRKKLADAEIGFFMHASFPSSEVFRCLPTRKDLLEGLLGANLIGLQTDEYVHHLLQTCSRLLNVEATENGILMENGRFVHVNTYPVGIDPAIIQAYNKSTEVDLFIKTFSEQYHGKKIVIARDKLDGIRGVYPKLLAYERFLKDFPKYRKNVVLIQIATTTTADSIVTSRVSDVVTRINSSYSSLSHHPLVFLNVDLDQAQWTALLGIADCLMITSLREGMNLTGHEFVLCQDGELGTTKHSPLILSEFTGAASVLKDNALLVNPWDQKNVSQALAQALKMSPQEKAQRWEKLREAVLHHDAKKWYTNYMDALTVAYQDHSMRDASSVPRLVVSDVKKIYDIATKRLLILDYEGTLATPVPLTDTVLATPKRSADVLNDLIEDPRNIVYVTSARPEKELTVLFKTVAGLGLIAENGGSVRKAGQSEWEDLCNDDHMESWKEGVVSVLSYYQDRMKGSVIEELHSYVLFKYDQAEDADIALVQASECANHINDLCAGQGVQAIPFAHGIFISDKRVNKAIAASKIIDQLRKAHSEDGETFPDMLLAIGDSREDEYVFDWAHNMRAEGIKDCVTVAVSQRNTAASFTVAQGVIGVLAFLQKLCAPPPTSA